MGIKYPVDEKYFLKWGRNMAYLLGYLYADGSLENAPYIRGKYLRASSIDRELIENIKRELKSSHPIMRLKPTSNGGSVSFFIRIGDHALYDSLIVKGLAPNKSLTMDFPAVPKKYLFDFLRGYFDGDGCV
jgi:hypothetical protein